MSEQNEFAHALAGAGGGALSMAITYPLVTLSTHAQTKSNKSQSDSKDAKKISTLTAFKKILEQDGILGLYSGLESAIYGIALTNFIYYYFYEFIANISTRTSSKSTDKRKNLNTLQSILCGAIAGSITCIGSNPLWVANTRMTVEKSNNSVLKTILTIIKKDGVLSLFNGVLPALVLVINPIIQYTIFEQLSNFIKVRRGMKNITPNLAFLIGAFGKLIATGSTYPYITLKSRMHLTKNSSEKISMFGLIKKILKEEGVEGFYNGISVKLVQSISTAAFLFFFKEELLASSIKFTLILQGLRKKALSNKL